MTRLAAGLVIVGDEPYEDCLASISWFDAIFVLTDNARVLEVVRRAGAHARLIKTPRFLEETSKELLAFAAEPWLLLIDPDECLVCSNPSLLLGLLESSKSNIAGYSLAYELRFLRSPLGHTYRGLRKTKLFRPTYVNWPAIIHSLPTARRKKHIFLELPDDVALIRTDLLGDVTLRLIRHAKWAAIEGLRRRSKPLDASRIAKAMGQILDEYFTDRSCGEDGVAGVLNGLLHLNKQIAELLFEAAESGISEVDRDRIYKLQNVFRIAARNLRAIPKGRL
jgi:hypothetical protein